MSIKSVATLMTPQMARKLLQANRENRPQKGKFIDYLVKEIKEGRWLTTSDGIGVATTGRVLNGQHRLEAIARAGVPVTVIVTTGLDEQAFMVTDNGNKRSVADNTGLPPNLVSDVMLLLSSQPGFAKLSRIAPQTILDAVDWWRPAYEAMMDGTQRLRRNGMDSAPIRVGMGLRWSVEKDPAYRSYVIEQYSRMIKGDVPALSRGAATLWGRLQRNQVGSTRTARLEGMATVFYHMDPRRAATTPLVRSMEETLEEVTQWIAMMPEAYLAGPTKDKHPYAWPKRPQVERKVYGAAAKRANEKAGQEVLL